MSFDIVISKQHRARFFIERRFLTDIHSSLNKLVVGGDLIWLRPR